MKLLTSSLAIAALLGLTACSTTAPVAKSKSAPDAVFVAQVTQFPHPEINEAASAYVSHFKTTIESALSERKYKRDMAIRYLSAEACFDSRASRLADRKLTSDEKKALVLTQVTPAQLKAYEDLSRGYFVRVNGLETFSCEIAGLKVDTSNVRY